jgi:hypothetical protein
MTTPTDGLVDVYLVGIPVAVSQQAGEHFEELSREFMHLAHADEAVRHDVPGRLLDLSDDLRRRFSGFTTANDAALEQAAAEGAATIDLHFRIPPEAGPAAAELAVLLDEADEYCAAGDYLLTLTTPPTALAYRRWYIGQFVDQLAGAAPVAFADWQARQAEVIA